MRRKQRKELPVAIINIINLNVLAHSFHIYFFKLLCHSEADHERVSVSTSLWVCVMSLHSRPTFWLADSVVGIDYCSWYLKTTRKCSVYTHRHTHTHTHARTPTHTQSRLNSLVNIVLEFKSGQDVCEGWKHSEDRGRQRPSKTINSEETQGPHLRSWRANMPTAAKTSIKQQN